MRNTRWMAVLLAALLIGLAFAGAARVHADVPCSHEWVTYAAKDPTCEQPGNSEYYQCRICKAYAVNQLDFDVETRITERFTAEDAAKLILDNINNNIKHPYKEGQEDMLTIDEVNEWMKHPVLYVDVGRGVKRELSFPTEEVIEQIYDAADPKICDKIRSSGVSDDIKLAIAGNGTDAHPGSPMYRRYLIGLYLNNAGIDVFSNYAALKVEAEAEIENVRKIAEKKILEASEVGGWVIPAFGHRWEDPTYVVEQQTNGTYLATATQKCSFDTKEDHVRTESVTAAVSAWVVPDCTNDGHITYVATFRDPAFEPQDTTEILPALGHIPMDPVWTVTPANGHKSAYVTFGCSREGCDMHDRANAEITSEITKRATYDETGLKTYYAVAEVNGEVMEKELDSVTVAKRTNRSETLTIAVKKDGSRVSGVPEGKFTVEATAKVSIEEPGRTAVLVALYDADGRFIGMETSIGPTRESKDKDKTSITYYPKIEIENNAENLASFKVLFVCEDGMPLTNYQGRP